MTGLAPFANEHLLPISDLQQVALAVGYDTVDRPLVRFYVPLLARAMVYRRVTGYFSSAILARAAAGFAPFIARGGRAQLIVGAQLTDVDVDAVIHGASLGEMTMRRLQHEPLDEGPNIIQNEYLRLFGWMVRQGVLDLRVGIPTDRDGRPLPPDIARPYFHSKYGLFIDEIGNRVAFSGSDNETPSGWLYNHETFHAYWSWNDSVWKLYGSDIEQRLHRLWDGPSPAGWSVLPLHDAVHDRLLTLVPPGWAPPAQDPDPRLRDLDGPSDPLGRSGWLPPRVEPQMPPAQDGPEEAVEHALEILRAPLSRTMVGITSAGVEPLPHQERVAVRAVETWPRGYLLADEVGLGKTIEAGLILRELLLSGRAATALLLVPASVLRQWQEELHEKINIDVPRYDGVLFLDRQDQALEPARTANPWSAFPLLLASSHLARRSGRRGEIISAGPWDIVLVDEAHHARRTGQKSVGPPNALLELLLQMHAAKSWRALYLATATPMQMEPHEAWDLIQLLDLPGRWGESASAFVRYFEHLRREPQQRDWSMLAEMLSDQVAETAAPSDDRLRGRIIEELGPTGSRRILDLHLRPPTPSKLDRWSETTMQCAGEWLRVHTPMQDRVFRHTRATMRNYQQRGLLPSDLVIPQRRIFDEFVQLTSAEQKLYDRIAGYIRRYYNLHLVRGLASRNALGFVMTIYRRRLTSSFAAVRASLDRRRNALRDGTQALLLDEDDRSTDADEVLPGIDALIKADRNELLRAEIDELDGFIADIDALGGRDSKADQLYYDLRTALSGGYESIVIFTQYTDTMDYLRDRIAGPYERVACFSGRGGEVWHPQSHTWRSVSKSRLKTAFRTGEVRVLLGTDSMSEGLNIQTCGRLINYDMPWNLMRVEQRIGRIDRIGADYRIATISNYFYAGTVEQKVYASIKADFGDFTEIVGDAQPVLAATESVISTAAMATDLDIDTAIIEGVRGIQQHVATALHGTVRLSDAETDVLERPTFQPAASLSDLRDALVSSSTLSEYLIPQGDGNQTFVLRKPDGTEQMVSFDPSVVENSDHDVVLLTWGSTEAKILEKLLVDSLGSSSGS